MILRLMDRFSLYSTPLFVFDIPAMQEANRELSARLLAEAEHSPGLLRGNQGGWHSVPNLSQRPENCYQHVMRTIVSVVGGALDHLSSERGIERVPAYRYGLLAWAMVMRDGDYTVLHDHGDAHWSLAYYVDAGDTDPLPAESSGLLAFVDPRRCGRPLPGVDLFPSTFTVAPRTSTLVLFPGWLQHYVHTYRGKRPRICISCNVTLDLAPPRSTQSPAP